MQSSDNQNNMRLIRLRMTGAAQRYKECEKSENRGDRLHILSFRIGVTYMKTVHETGRDSQTSKTSKLVKVKDYPQYIG